MQSARDAVRSLLTAGAVLAAGVLACVLRAPKPLDTGDGLSWFGVQRVTVVEYGLALLVAAALLARAAAALAGDPGLRPLRVGLLACAVLMPVLLATPYTVSTAFNWTHMIVGSVLFVLQLLLCAWLWWARARAPLVGGLLAAQIAGGVVCFTSMLDLDGAMLQGQLVFQVAFTACLALGVAVASRQPANAPSSRATSSCPK